ncbi:MAG: polyphosphate kinase 2 family protein [Chloroflexota bacterium]|nr:polyphosphate kinase 2 family protein [Chloroflexota bacterium]
MGEQLLIPEFGKKVDLKDFDPAYNEGSDKGTAQAEEAKLEERFAELQDMLYAQGKHALLVVFQAMDAGGKDGAIKKVFDSVNPQGVRVASFKVPTPLELSHDFLWRIHQQAPPKGYIGIFNRSHYEDVLVVRVNEIVPKTVWEKRYDRINEFERLLVDSGTTILKFYLHISKDEQRERLQARLDDPSKHWKFSVGDLPVRERWDDYMAAYEDVFTRCNHAHAPWHIVPANKKWYRDLVITRTIVSALEGLKLAYPEPDFDPATVTIPD